MWHDAFPLFETPFGTFSALPERGAAGGGFGALYLGFFGS
jgi:hypothetical protein